MRFDWIPRLTISKEEFITLDNALKLCRDMDMATSIDENVDFEDNQPYGCDICPKRETCSRFSKDCVFTIAHKTLKEIIDMAVIK